MTVETREIIALICTLAEEEKLRVCVKETLKGALITGLSAGAMGMFLGAVGFAIGGFAGGCAAGVLAKGKFLPAVQVIATMQPEKRNILVNQVTRIMTSVEITDVAALAALITGNISVRQRVLEAVIDHLRCELNLAVVEH